MKKVLFLIRRLLAFAFFFALGEEATGQPSSLFWRQLDATTGFSNEWAWDMLVDSEGWLWIGTPDGLARSSGLGTELFLPDSTDRCSLPELYISGGIFEDKKGDIWLGANGRIARRSRQTDCFELADVADRAGARLEGIVRLVRIDGDGSIWVLVVQETRSIFGKARAADWPRLRFEAQTELPAGIDRCRMDARGGPFFVALERGSPSLAFGEAGQKPFLAQAQTILFDIFIQSPDSVWAAGRGAGLFFFGEKGRKKAIGPVGKGQKAPKKPLAIARGAGADLWVGDESGSLHRFDLEKKQFAEAFFADETDPHGLPRDSVTNLLIDPRGAVYAAHVRRGVAWAVPSKKCFESQPLTDGAAVRSLFRLPGGRLGWATSTAIFSKSEGEKSGKRLAALPSRSIQKAVADAAGNVWAVDQLSVFYLEQGAKKARAIFSRADAGGTLTDLCLLPDGRAVATSYAGAHLFEKGASGAFSVKTMLKKGCSAAWADAEGRLFLAHYLDGLTVLLPDGRGGFDEKGAKNLPLAGDVRAWAEDSARVWAAVNYGLASISKRDFRVDFFGKKHGLPALPFSSIVDDGAGGLWLGGQNGLAFFDKKSEKARAFSRSDGLGGAAFSAQSAAASADGKRLFFACGTELLAFNGERALQTSAAPRAQILRILIDGERDSTLRDLRTGAKSAERIERLRLAWRQRSVSFEFWAVDQTDPEGARTEFRLVGYDSAWQVTERNPATVRFPKLAAGGYRFEVRGVGSDGARGAEIRSISFEVEPPFYQIWWFWALAAAAAVAAVRFFSRQKIRRLERFYAMREQLRKQIATDLHDEVGGSLTAITRFSETLKMMVSSQRADPAETQRLLNRIGDISKKTALAFRDSIWAINPENDRLADLAAQMRSAAAGLCEAAGIGLQFEPKLSDADRLLSPELRHHVFLIFKEALHNAVKYASASHILIELETDAQGLRLAVRDDGRGFDLATVRRSNGLNSMERRAKEIGAQLFLDSSAAGTNVVLSADWEPGRG